MIYLLFHYLLIAWCCLSCELLYNILDLLTFIILVTQNAPMFKNMTGRKGGAAGSGKSAILRAQGRVFFVI